MSRPQEALFDAPPVLPKPRRKARPVDLVQLARQTGGDRALEEEVLRLFLRQAQSIGRAMREQPDTETRKRNAHTLKGAARSIGAGAIAERARLVEEAPGERNGIRALLREIDTTCDFINAILR